MIFNTNNADDTKDALKTADFVTKLIIKIRGIYDYAINQNVYSEYGRDEVLRLIDKSNNITIPAIATYTLYAIALITFGFAASTPIVWIPAAVIAGVIALQILSIVAFNLYCSAKEIMHHRMHKRVHADVALIGVLKTEIQQLIKHKCMLTGAERLEIDLKINQLNKIISKQPRKSRKADQEQQQRLQAELAELKDEADLLRKDEIESELKCIEQRNDSKKEQPYDKSIKEDIKNSKELREEAKSILFTDPNNVDEKLAQRIAQGGSYKYNLALANAVFKLYKEANNDNVSVDITKIKNMVKAVVPKNLRSKIGLLNGFIDEITADNNDTGKNFNLEKFRQYCSDQSKNKTSAGETVKDYIEEFKSKDESNFQPQDIIVVGAKLLNIMSLGTLRFIYGIVSGSIQSIGLTGSISSLHNDATQLQEIIKKISVEGRNVINKNSHTRSQSSPNYPTETVELIGKAAENALTVAEKDYNRLMDWTVSDGEATLYIAKAQCDIAADMQAELAQDPKIIPATKARLKKIKVEQEKKDSAISKIAQKQEVLMCLEEDDLNAIMNNRTSKEQYLKMIRIAIDQDTSADEKRIEKAKDRLAELANEDLQRLKEIFNSGSCIKDILEYQTKLLIREVQTRRPPTIRDLLPLSRISGYDTPQGLRSCISPAMSKTVEPALTRWLRTYSNSEEDMAIDLLDEVLQQVHPNMETREARKFLALKFSPKPFEDKVKQYEEYICEYATFVADITLDDIPCEQSNKSAFVGLNKDAIGILMDKVKIKLSNTDSTDDIDKIVKACLEIIKTSNIAENDKKDFVENLKIITGQLKDFVTRMRVKFEHAKTSEEIETTQKTLEDWINKNIDDKDKAVYKTSLKNCAEKIEANILLSSQANQQHRQPRAKK